MLKKLLKEVKGKVSNNTATDDFAVRVVSSGIFSCFEGYDLVVSKTALNAQVLGQISDIAYKHRLFVKSVENYLVICG